MKSNILLVSAVLAAIAAVFLLPVSAAAAGVAFTAAGVFSVFMSDYGRSIKPLRASAQIVPFGDSGFAPDRLNRAA
jgi:hypothetical protein